jgi:hypothetical protein
MYLATRMQVRKDFAGKQILLKADGFVIGKRLSESIGKRAVACRRFEEAEGTIPFSFKVSERACTASGGV